MSSNSGVIVNRSNETAPFFQAIKSRNSKSLPELYSAEINTEAQAQSRVEVESSSAGGYNRTMRISLPRYGVLNKLYIKTEFSKATHSASSSNAVQAVPFIGALAFREVRLMYNGSVIQKASPYQIISDLWKHGSDNERRKLIDLLGALDQESASFGTGNVANSVKPSERTTAGQTFFCPLDFFFSSRLSPNRGLDLSVLANECILECDIETQTNIWKKDGTVAALPDLERLSAMCYLTEFDMEVEKQYRSLQYQAGGAPLTQIAYNTEHVIVATNTAHASKDTIVDVKLNQFTGQVYKLVVFAVLTDNFATNRHRVRPMALGEIQLKATGTNIFNYNALLSKEDILESYHSGGNHEAISDTASYATAITCRASNFYELNLKHPYDMSKVSASGSVAIGQLSVPSLRVVVPIAGHQMGAQSNVISSGAFDLHVIAYSTTLVSYNTNTSGSTNLRMIQN